MQGGGNPEDVLVGTPTCVFAHFKKSCPGFRVVRKGKDLRKVT